jgi:hypothetical protein
MGLDVAICCIALDEELYIDEWLDHHLNKLGFNHVYVYDNSPQEGTLKPRKNVTVIHFPGSTKQVPAYNHFLENFGKKHDWCAFIDVDEFFVLKKHATIQEYLLEESRGLSAPVAIGVNWVLFGSDGQEKYEPRPVMERFTKGTMNQHIKSIVRTRGLSNQVSFENCHIPRDIPVTVHIPSNGKTDYVFNTPSNTNFDDSVIQLNHYFCKSREEFEKKISRGRADTTEMRTMSEFF